MNKSNMQHPYNATWTLFLDRDGVINTCPIRDYILDKADFHLIEGVPEAVAKLSKIFGRIVVATQQQCVGKGLISQVGLDEIHEHLSAQLVQSGGRLDAVFAATKLAPDDHLLWRKPGPGMAYAAKQMFPEIAFSHAVMVGDTTRDMQFGHQLGMQCILVGYKPKTLDECADIPLTGTFKSLWHWVQTLD